MLERQRFHQAGVLEARKAAHPTVWNADMEDGRKVIQTK
jgi:hypothetical protein